MKARPSKIWSPLLWICTHSIPATLFSLSWELIRHTSAFTLPALLSPLIAWWLTPAPLCVCLLHFLRIFNSAQKVTKNNEKNKDMLNIVSILWDMLKINLQWDIWFLKHGIIKSVISAKRWKDQVVSYWSCHLQVDSYIFSNWPPLGDMHYGPHSGSTCFLPKRTRKSS